MFKEVKGVESRPKRAPDVEGLREQARRRLEQGQEWRKRAREYRADRRVELAVRNEKMAKEAAEGANTWILKREGAEREAEELRLNPRTEFFTQRGTSFRSFGAAPVDGVATAQEGVTPVRLEGGDDSTRVYWTYEGKVYETDDDLDALT